MTALHSSGAALLVVMLAAPLSAQQPRTVTLPLPEYNRLVDLASRPPQPAPGPPVAAVLSSADLRVRVERDSVRGTFALAGDVLRDGVNRVNLVAGATLIEGTAAGRPLPLASDGGTHAALLPGPGPFALTLEWGAPLSFTPGRGAFTLPVPQAGTARTTIDLPGDQADVHLEPGLITRRATVNGRTIVEATLRPGAASTVWWSMRDSAPVAAAREARTLADVLTLITVGDSDVRMVSLVDVTVAQGEPRTIGVRLPAGYEVTSVSGSTLESSEQQGGTAVLTVSDPAARRHQFLITLERPHAGGSFSLDTDFIALPQAQRERGEIAIEGVGTLELATAEHAPVHRIDVRELNGALQSLARLPLLSAFRYQRTAGASIALAFDVKRFADAGVLAAVADRAVATTLVTSEGRALTEVVLTILNRAQPFLKVLLPAGATMVSVEVGGETAKPAIGADGTRVPLLRSGFRPTGAYRVSFVYLHAGTPFARKGELEMTLPKMDIPVGLLEWEVFVPERYAARATDGNVLDRRLFPYSVPVERVSLAGSGAMVVAGAGGGVGPGTGDMAFRLQVAPGQGDLRGRVRDQTGGNMPGVTVTLTAGTLQQTVTTDATGAYAFGGIPAGPVTLVATLQGFTMETRSFAYDGAARQVDLQMRVSTVEATVTVNGQSTAVDQKAAANREAAAPAPPSQNVLNLQKRAAGVLPIRVDVPRAGVSHQFVKPLVVDEQPAVKLRYKLR